MLTTWTQKYKTQEEKDAYKKRLLGSRWVLEDQTDIIKDMLKALEYSEMSVKTYDVPNWEARQAHMNGVKQCLHQILKLNNLDQKENNDR